MEAANENRKLYPFKKGWNELKAKDQPAVRETICEYFAKRSKLAKGNKIGKQAWRNRLKGQIAKVEDIEFIKAVFKGYGINKPFNEA